MAGGVGTPGPVFPWPFEPGWGFYYFCFLLAAIATWITANIGSSRYGRALVAIRDAEVAAEASGIAKPKLLILVPVPTITISVPNPRQTRSIHAYTAIWAPR